VDPVPSDVYRERMEGGDCEVCPVAALQHYLSYDTFLSTFFGADSAGDPNYGRFAVADFDRLLAEARATPEADQRADLPVSGETRTRAGPVLWSGRTRYPVNVGSASTGAAGPVWAGCVAWP
jgi:hypothetical protein